MAYSASDELNCPLALVIFRLGFVSTNSSSASETTKSIPADRTCTHSMEGKAARRRGSCLRALGQDGETKMMLGCSLGLTLLRSSSKSASVEPVWRILEPKGRDSERALLASSSESAKTMTFASFTMDSGEILMR